MNIGSNVILIRHGDLLEQSNIDHEKNALVGDCRVGKISGKIIAVLDDQVSVEPVLDEPVLEDQVFDELVSVDPVFEVHVFDDQVSVELVFDEPVFEDQESVESVFDEPLCDELVSLEGVFEAQVSVAPVLDEPV